MMYSKLFFPLCVLILFSFTCCQSLNQNEQISLKVDNDYYKLSITQATPQATQGQAEGSQLIQYTAYHPVEILKDLYRKQDLELKSLEIATEHLPKIHLNCRYQADIERLSISDSIAQQIAKTFGFQVIKGQYQEKTLFLTIVDRGLLAEYQVLPTVSAGNVVSKESLRGKKWTAEGVSLGSLRRRISQQLETLFFAEEFESNFHHAYNFELDFSNLTRLNEGLKKYGMKIIEGKRPIETRVITTPI